MSLTGSTTKRAVLAATFAAFALGATLAAVPATAADDAIFAPGQPIVTGFPGVVPPDPDTIPDGADPLDYTFIDPDGASASILDLHPDDAPTGELLEAPPVFAAKASDVGLVFGVALDRAPDFTADAAPNVYLAATSNFGINIVVPDGDGNPVRSANGDPEATFMPGQWGNAGGAEGYPGSIWKIDGETGEVSLFSTIAANTGAGLGAIVYDPSSAQFFASDLDTGLIYRLSEDGTILDTYDHGVDGRPALGLDPVEDDGSVMDITDPAFSSEDPSTWGFTQPERRVIGLAAEAGRIYYSVNGPQIWSVRINADGSFGTPRWELDVADLPSNNDVTDIAFDPRGRMVLAQRGATVGSYDYGTLAEPGTSSVVALHARIPRRSGYARHLDRNARQLRHRLCARCRQCVGRHRLRSQFRSRHRRLRWRV